MWTTRFVSFARVWHSDTVSAASGVSVGERRKMGGTNRLGRRLLRWKDWDLFAESLRGDVPRASTLATVLGTVISAEHVELAELEELEELLELLELELAESTRVVSTCAASARPREPRCEDPQ